MITAGRRAAGWPAQPLSGFKVVPLLVGFGTSSADEGLAAARTAFPMTPKQWHIPVPFVGSTDEGIIHGR